MTSPKHSRDLLYFTDQTQNSYFLSVTYMCHMNIHVPRENIVDLISNLYITFCRKVQFHEFENVAGGKIMKISDLLLYSVHSIYLTLQAYGVM